MNVFGPDFGKRKSGPQYPTKACLLTYRPAILVDVETGTALTGRPCLVISSVQTAGRKRYVAVWGRIVSGIRKKVMGPTPLVAELLLSGLCGRYLADQKFAC